MLSSQARSSHTSQGFLALSPWKGDYNNPHAYSAINLGNNFIAKLEIVSSLNSFNITHLLYHYDYLNCTEKYNPKVHLGAIQTASTNWIFDRDSNRAEAIKSGSWPTNFISNV